MYRLYHRPNLLEASGLAGSIVQVPSLVLRTLRNALYRVVRAHQESFEIRSLRRLDDHLLRDIGIARADIPAAVKAALDADEASRSPSAGPARFREPGLPSLRLRPCVNC